MKNIKKIFTALVLITLGTVFAFSQDKGIVILESEYPHDMNPHTSSYSQDAQIFTGLYEGLFSYDPVTLNPQYAIAKNYKISRDKKRITFVLREDACFSNGEKITAASVRESWLQLLDTPNAPYSSMLDIIRGAQSYRLGKGSQEDVGIYASGEYSLSVYLTSPANYLPKILCHPAFSVVHRIPTVYSGPYQLEDQSKGYLLLKKNPYYWDKANVPTETISFVQSSDASENAFLFNTGLADWVVADVDTEKVINKDTFQISAEFATFYWYFKTSAKKPGYKGEFNPWDHAEFRSAVLEAMPWDTVRAGNLVFAPTLVYPLGDYPAIDGFSYTDIIEAQHLMKQAREKYNVPMDQLLTLTFDLMDKSVADEKLEALSANLLQIGVMLKVRKISNYTYYSLVSSSNSDMFLSTWIGDFADPLAFLMLFQSDSTLNDSGWKNAEFDSLIEAAAAADDSQRSQLLAKAEKLLLDSGIVLPIYHPISFNLIDLQSIGGWSSNAFDLHPLKYLYKKEVKTKLPNVVLN